MVRSGRFFAKKGRMAHAASLFLLFLCHDDAQERAAAGGMRGKSVWACAAPPYCMVLGKVLCAKIPVLPTWAPQEVNLQYAWGSRGIRVGHVCSFAEN